MSSDEAHRYGFVELESLGRAAFLAPHQCERKRLVERLVRDLERRNCSDSASASKLQDDPLDAERSVSSSSSQSSEDPYVSTLAESTAMDGFPTKADQILPRSLRKRQKEDVVDDRYRKRVKMAEDALLSSNTVGDDLEEFFDSL
ncbi:hypothetical protein LSM04_000953 [Trypanosoma melophagium]|uniref:uncharacterized protein n=1 Tax=Trypanosoma melophagium TaxID=715481 RepID=UPI00351A2143|nr:hypothetical protein LSM04_000953 [Trypanosoma melophagium]